MAIARILIVEDEILIARKIESSLCQLGYEVVGIASDAEVAIQKTTESYPDLVLMDIVIQGDRDGVTVAQQLRDRFQIPVIYLTAYADEETLQRAKLTQPLGYILKPFNRRDLRVAIEIALSRHQIEVDLQNRQIDHQASSGAESNHPVPLRLEHLSILSHELRIPLSVIKISASMLGDYGHRLSEQSKQECLNRIQIASDSINQLLEDVLTLGRTGSSQTQFTPSYLDIVNFCQEMLNSLRWNLGEQSHELTFFCPQDCIFAYVDAKLLWHLLNNLLTNAIKYSPQGGEVNFTLECQDNELVFMVQDAGIGIPEADQPRLFEPFRRGSNVGELPGTGLGLAIAQRAAELHGGVITLQSQIGQGTTFVVRIPLNIL